MNLTNYLDKDFLYVLIKKESVKKVYLSVNDINDIS